MKTGLTEEFVEALSNQASKQTEIIINLKDLNEELLEALQLALPYVVGAYECAFPNQSENEYVRDRVESAIQKAKGL